MSFTLPTQNTNQETLLFLHYYSVRIINIYFNEDIKVTRKYLCVLRYMNNYEII